MSRWKPIDTAPKDEDSEIDLWSLTEGRVANASWHGDRPYRGGWRQFKAMHDDGYADYSEVELPTYWMPIQEADDDAWLPMRTAPSDGSSVDLLTAKHVRVAGASWSEAFGDWVAYQADPDASYAGIEPVDNPISWMPIPEDPE